MIQAQIIDGKALAAKIRLQIAEEIKKLATDKRPCLATVLVGDDPASVIYVRNKMNASKEVGIDILDRHLPATTSESELLKLLAELGQDKKVSGILVQLPLPSQIKAPKIFEAMPQTKDVDGFGINNWGRLFQAKTPAELEKCFIPCTPFGVLKMLESCEIKIEGKSACVIGRSNIVGKPLAHLLTLHNATTTVCHSKTRDIPAVSRQADILIAAMGKPGFVKEDMVKEGACVIDVGINRLATGKLSGDCDFEGVSRRAAYISPVPGGVGPMTIAMLLSNTLLAFKRQNGIS